MKTATGSHSGRSVQKIESLGPRREKGYGGAGGRRKELGKRGIGEGAMGGDLGKHFEIRISGPKILMGLLYHFLLGLKGPLGPFRFLGLN